MSTTGSTGFKPSTALMSQGSLLRAHSRTDPRAWKAFWIELTESLGTVESPTRSRIFCSAPPLSSDEGARDFVMVEVASHKEENAERPECIEQNHSAPGCPDGACPTGPGFTRPPWRATRAADGVSATG